MAKLRKKLIDLIRYCTSCEECRDEDIADHLIAAGVIAQQWIPVTERAPEDGFPVLATCGKGYSPFVARYDLVRKRWRVSHTLRITHWMPLPISPREE